MRNPLLAVVVSTSLLVFIAIKLVKLNVWFCSYTCSELIPLLSVLACHYIACSPLFCNYRLDCVMDTNNLDPSLSAVSNMDPSTVPPFSSEQFRFWQQFFGKSQFYGSRFSSKPGFLNASMRFMYPNRIRASFFVTIRLNRLNFLIWKSHIVNLIESQECLD